MTIREELHIDCAPVEAFDLMADVRRLTDWNEGASMAEMTSEEPIQLGSRFDTVNRRQKLVSTITTFNRPDRLDFSVTNKNMDVAAAFHFTPAATGTDLVIEFNPRPKGIMKALFPVLKPLIQRDLVAQHLKFKAYCEAKTQSRNA